MKRDLFKFFVLIFLMGIVGCGDKNMEEAQQEEPEEVQKLMLWSYYETEAQQEGLDKLVEGFNESQDKYQISWEYVPMTDFNKKLTFSESRDDFPDLMLVDNSDMESLIKIGLLADLTESLEGKISKEEYYSEVWKSVEYQGQYYGIPFSCHNTAIIYNKQMFREKKLNVPVTWSDFKRVALELTKGGSRARYGFAMPAASGEQAAFQFMPWILSTGVSGQELADEKVLDAFYLIDQLLKDKSMPNDCMNWSQNDVTRSFLAGRVAMIENGPWALPEIEKSGIDYGIFEIPAYACQEIVIGGENLVVVKGKNLEGAMAFMDYYNQEQVMGKICQAALNIPPKRELAADFGEKNPDYQVFINQMEKGISNTSVNDWKNVSRAISDSLNKMFGSEYNMQQIWQQYRDEILR